MNNPKESIPVSPSLHNTFNDTEGYTEDTAPISIRILPLSLQAILNAILISIIAKSLVLLINGITNLSFYHRFSFRPASPEGNTLGLSVIVVPIAGSILVGLIARFGSSAIRGHGIPEAMEKIILHESKIPPRLTFLKPLSSAISIGTGGPFGAEGPIIATGGAFGSLTGQIMRISASERKIILTAGACAGMAAIFGTPVAAVMLAIELLLFEYAPKSLIPVALACATGAAMHLFLFDSKPVFHMAPILPPSGNALLTYILMGGFIGIVASLISKSVYWVEDQFEKLPVHWMWWPAIGAIAVGITGLYAPNTMGVGYENIVDLLKGSLTVSALCVLCFLKYLSWVISLGSGTSGGTLAPLFTIGGAFGALLGMGILALFPASGITIASAALIGMASMFAGASRAILTSILFALETTGQVEGLLPLLGACTAAYLVAMLLSKGSIMTEKIQRRGVRTPHSYEPDVLRTINAGDLVKKVAIMVSIENTVGQLRGWLSENMSRYPYHFLIVIDEEENFLGYVERKRLFSSHVNEFVAVKEILSESTAYVYEEQDAGSVSEIMGSTKMDVIAVLSNKIRNKVTGMITTTEIVTAYSDNRSREKKYQRHLSVTRRTLRFMIKGKSLMKANSDKIKVT
ncbi:MAG: chloride channel protein [Bacteroidetes bacterium]|nr:chloride channel protein [Bacteroidota bacterium]